MMANAKPGRYRATFSFPGDAMSRPVLAMYNHHTIPIWAAVSRPFVTWRAHSFSKDAADLSAGATHEGCVPLLPG